MLKTPASKTFAVAVALTVVLPFIPILKWGLFPFDILNTHLHEMFHAISAMVSGGQVDHIEVYKTGAGVTWSRGGIVPLIQMSGYLGASLFGALMVMLCRTSKSSMIWLRILGGLVLASNVLWVRGDILGWTLGFAWPIVIFFVSSRIKGEALIMVAQFLAVQQCLNSVKSLRDLFLLSGTDVVTDAQLLANDTHIPAVVWAMLWMAVSLFGIIMAMIKINRLPQTVSSATEPSPDRFRSG